MEMEGKKGYCPILDVDGVISGGKQFDLDITLPDVSKKKYQKRKSLHGFFCVFNYFIKVSCL